MTNDSTFFVGHIVHLTRSISDGHEVRVVGIGAEADDVVSGGSIEASSGMRACAQMMSRAGYWGRVITGEYVAK